MVRAAQCDRSARAGGQTAGDQHRRDRLHRLQGDGQPIEQAARDIEDAEAQPEKQSHKRVAGLGKGTIAIADDFDDPLPDSFWVGEE